jgi:(p)ppGpp synthase/HD superfamily hydrolase
MPNRPITPKEKKAWTFAKEAHKGQVRKFVNKPYFNAHVQKVNSIVKQYTTDEDILCVSLLHDVIEDCFEDKEVGYQIISDTFGGKIADMVLELTSSKEEIKNEYNGNKAEYLIDKLLNMSDDALIVKLADRLQNISDAFAASERFRNNYFHETNHILDSLESNRKLNRIQSRLVEQIKNKLSNIGKLFRIKRFNEMFENSDNLYQETKNDIHDIILELIDTNKIRFGFNEPHQLGKFLMIRTKRADVPLYWSDISEYVLRVIDYLGDRFAIARIKKHPNYRKDRSSNINTEPDYMDIDIDENTDIDFGLWSIAIKWN